MAIKTFNIDAMLYESYKEHCKKSGISMSKKVENFIRQELDKIKAEIPGKFFGIKGLKKESNNVKIEDVSQQEHSFRKYC